MVYTNVGVERLIEFFRGESPTHPTYIASGTDNTTPQVSDTALFAEKIRKEIGLSVTYTDTTITFSVLIDSTIANGNILNECGLFDASTAGNMFSRFTHTGVTKNSAVEVEYSITLKILNI